MLPYSTFLNTPRPLVQVPYQLTHGCCFAARCHHQKTQTRPEAVKVCHSSSTPSPPRPKSHHAPRANEEKHARTCTHKVMRIHKFVCHLSLDPLFFGGKDTSKCLEAFWGTPVGTEEQSSLRGYSERSSTFIQDTVRDRRDLDVRAQP